MMAAYCDERTAALAEQTDRHTSGREDLGMGNVCVCVCVSV